MGGFLLKPHSTSQSSGPSCSKGGYSAIHQINLYQLDAQLVFIIYTYPLDSDLYLC